MADYEKILNSYPYVGGGARHQYGGGIGSFLKGAYRWVLPHIKHGAIVAGTEAIKSGLEALQKYNTTSAKKRGWSGEVGGEGEEGYKYSDQPANRQLLNGPGVESIPTKKRRKANKKKTKQKKSIQKKKK